MSISIENMLSDSLMEQMPPHITLTSNNIRENEENMLDLAREYSTVKIILDDKQFFETAFQNDPVSIQQFNSIRRLISNTPNPNQVVWTFAITTLIISLIGGRLWIGVIQWAATITAVTSALIIFIIMATRMYSHQFETIITDSMRGLITDFNGSMDIILQIFNNVVLELTTSIQTQFQLWLIVSLITMLVPFLYRIVHKRLT